MVALTNFGRFFFGVAGFEVHQLQREEVIALIVFAVTSSGSRCNRGVQEVIDRFPFLLHDGVMAGLSAAPRLVRNWRRVLETLRHGAEDGAGVGRGPELLAVAVDPAASGRGIGTALVAAFLAEVTSAGDTAAHVVVGADNDRAIALYRSAGFIMVDTFELHAGTTSLLMQWDAPSGPSSQDKVGNR